VQTFYDAGMRVWIGDEANGIQAETTINRTAAAQEFVAAESPLELAAELAALTVFEGVMSAAIPAGQLSPLRSHQ